MTAWKDDIIGINPHSRSGKRLTAVKKLVVHYTANPGATAANHRNYFANLTDRDASAHIFIDKTEALCIVPLNEVAFHANDNQKKVNGEWYRGIDALKPNANYLSIGVELCIEKDGTFHPNTIARAVDVFADLCKKFHLTAGDIVRHYDITSKNCPAPWVGSPAAFNDFKVKVAKALSTPPANEEPVLQQWEKDAIAWAVKNGVSDGTRPHDTTNRVEVMAMMQRVYKLLGGK
jgi:N-acetylmuramoyl-L-alanine amidase CwlA